MANYPTHLCGGIVVGITGVLLSQFLVLTPLISTPIIALAGIFGGIAPDIDHDHGRPIRILFRWTSLIVPSLLLFRFYHLHDNPINLFAIWIVLSFLIYFPIKWLFMWCTVHRGIFHSVPAIGIFAAILYLLSANKAHDHTTQLVIAITGGCGYLIHLLLDELWSVDFNGKAIKLKRSHGTAMSLFKKNHPLTSVFAYLLLGGLIYLCVQDYNNQPLAPLFTFWLETLQQ